MEKVLLISDNHALEPAFKEKASPYNLDVTFCSETDAKFKLRGEHLTKWSAVIVDTCLEVRDKYLKRLELLKTPITKYIPTDGIEPAIKDIVEKVIVSPTRKIDALYEEIFIIVKDYWGDDAEDTLRILKSILIKMHEDDPDIAADLDIEYTRLRKVLHPFFQVCLSFGLLPDYCKKDNLTQCACTLAGKPKLIYDKDEIDNRQILLPRRLREAIWSIIQAGNDESHISGVDFSWMLLHSYTLKLCELIFCIGKYINDNPNKEQNATFYDIEYNVKPQTIETDSDGFFHCGEIQLPQNVKVKYQAGEKIAMKKVIMNADLNTRYPYFAKYIN